MKKKGFTLIELLAVIVILAIIALIATPLVLKYIEKSRKESKVDSAYSFVRNLENEIANFSIKYKGSKYNFKPANNDFFVEKDFNDSNIDTSVKGDKPDTIKVCLSSLGQVNKAVFKYGNYYVSYDGKKGSIADESIFTSFSCSGKGGDTDLTFGAPVTFDVDKGAKCDYYTDAQSANGVKSGCMKFYVLNDNGDTVDLILDHNTTNVHDWNSHIDGGNTNNGPDVLLQQLLEDTKSWEGTLTPTNYTRYKDGSDEVKYNIDYKNYKARILTAEEVLNLMPFYTNLSDDDKRNWGNLYEDKVDEKMEYIQNNVDFSKYGDDVKAIYGAMIDEISKTEIGLPKFLYDNLIGNCNLDANGYFVCESEGYWTGTAIESYPIKAWYIEYTGCFNKSDSYGPYMDDVGIRPVIKVSKDKLNK